MLLEVVDWSELAVRCGLEKPSFHTLLQCGLHAGSVVVLIVQLVALLLQQLILGLELLRPEPLLFEALVLSLLALLLSLPLFLQPLILELTLTVLASSGLFVQSLLPLA